MKLKSKIILLLFTICFSQITFGQFHKPKIVKSKNQRLVKVLNDLQLIGKNNDNYLSVKIYKIDNGSGSAGIEDGDETSYNLFIAVSGFDENPKQNLFEIGPFYNPKFVEWIKIKEYEREFKIKFGGVNDSKFLTLKVNLNNLNIIK